MVKVHSTFGKPTHIKWIAAGLGIECLGFDYGINDYMKWRFTGERKIHRSIVYFNSKGEAYIKWNGSRHYLNDFMRVDY